MFGLKKSMFPFISINFFSMVHLLSISVSHLTSLVEDDKKTRCIRIFMLSTNGVMLDYPRFVSIDRMYESYIPNRLLIAFVYKYICL